ncbi:MBL fold metallo-hydrolase [Bacillaceae bacterium SIJ1]|uniref:MBL fold metallo-hydrolase n=1 Tax=Litoribacterium kuwaitense TaxID=1398745 RepID=UPI0013EB1987|nr:MBL fold metallo-hydrolase [Litoribacterium kuwaitense]NGP45585.1 MBL fold metallo-hydrolase [Litoribacterium kuwaitense]
MAKTIEPQQLMERMLSKQKTTVLDVRATDVFEEWKLEGEAFDVINEPYVNLLDDVSALEGRLNKDDEVVVICNRGNSSTLVVEQLEANGYTNVVEATGGMSAWGEYLYRVKISDLKDGGALYQFVRSGKGCLSYMVVADGKAVVVDAARMTEVYEAFAEEQGVEITHVIDTHLHADHISGGRSLAAKTGATYLLPEGDAGEVTYSFTPLEEGKDIQLGSSAVTVRPMHSPGHTPGSTSLMVDDRFILTGDILFLASIGRPDLAGKAEAWADNLYTTLQEKLMSLPEHLYVLPGHFAETTELNDQGAVVAELGDIKKNNNGLNVKEEQAFHRMVTENLPPQPNAYQDIRMVNMGKQTPDADQQKEMESGPNRCAVN